MKTDFFVIGSGIAGLTYALKVAQDVLIKVLPFLPKPKR